MTLLIVTTDHKSLIISAMRTTVIATTNANILNRREQTPLE